MTDIPSELKLNILEYGRGGLNVSQEELIKRIREYEPSFDYDVWLNKIALKRDFLKKYRNHPFKDLLLYLRSLNMAFVISAYENPIGISTSGPFSITVLDRITDSFKEAGYTIDRIEYESITEEGPTTINNAKIYSSDWEAIRYDLAAAGMLIPHKETNDTSYNNKSGIASDEGFGNLVAISDILNIPFTLNSYLSYALRRQKEYEKIKKYKSYPLYLMIDRYRWVVHWPIATRGETILSLGLEDISNNVEEQVHVADIMTELVSLYGPGNVSPPGRYGDIELTGSYRLELIDIDRFFHPYMVMDVHDFI